MNILKRSAIFLEQVTYPEQSREERFLIGLRRRGWWQFWVWDKFIYQVHVTSGEVKTYWGVERRRLLGEPDIEAASKRLVGALCTDYPLEVGAFQVVKDVPRWPLEAERTLALELRDTPAVFDEGSWIEAPHSSLVSSLVARGTTIGDGKNIQKNGVSLLEVVRELVRSVRGDAVPLVIQVVFKGIWAGSTRQVKRKRRSGERWAEDPYRTFREQLKLVERARGKTLGYWAVTARVLAPRGLGELISGLNRVFTFRHVKAARAIARFERGGFGQRIQMSSAALGRVIQVPTGEIFPRELLGGATTGQGTHGRQWTRPFPKEGYILGKDEGGVDICLDEEMLRAHILLIGRTGCRKTSLMRFFALELARHPQNRLFILDYAGEYTQLLEHLGKVVVLRPGSEEFQLGINFLDWAETLEVDVHTAESWILKVLETLIRGRRGLEFTAKMETMLRELIRRELKQKGTLINLFQDLWALRTRIRQTKGFLGQKKAQGEELTENKEMTLADYGEHDRTIEAIQNRLRDLYGSPLRRVFFVRQTTVQVEDLLERHVILDLSELRRQGLSNDLLRLFCEFILLYLSRGVALRRKGQISRRNIVIFEEAQQLVPEVLVKRTLVDGTTPEELIGTLGGFGVTFIFISAQPGLLSRAIMAGCHTKVVFSLQGREAALLADMLDVEAAEVAGLQVGESLVRAAGTGVSKVWARTWQVYPETAVERLEMWQQEFPSEVVKRARAAYEFLGEQPLEYYSTLVEVIEEVVGEGKKQEEAGGMAEEKVGCWAQEVCGLCERRSYIVELGSKYAEQYWNKTKRTTLQTKLKLYPVHPLILYTDLRALTENADLDDPELIAFCAHWGLMERCATDATLSKSFKELSIAGREAFVAQFVAVPEIKRLVEASQTLFERGSAATPAFSLRDRFCGVCPLDQALRDLFCGTYRQEAVRRLEDPELESLLWETYHIDFRQFLEACFTEVSWDNPGASYCLVTAFLKRSRLSQRQRGILMDIAKEFLAEVAVRQRAESSNGSSTQSSDM